MSLDDIKDRLASDARLTWERLQESGAYNQLKDRYENMSPSMQKVTLYGAIAFVAFMVLSVPYSYFSTSSDYVQEYESKRQTIREMLKVTRESADVPQIPRAPDIQSLKSTIDGQIQRASLLPEQVLGTEVQQNTSALIPANLTEGLLQVRLAKLNIRQIIDLGHQFSSISPSVKMKDLVMTANRQDNRYFDVVYRLVTLAVPAVPELVPEDNTGSGRSFRNRNNNSDE